MPEIPEQIIELARRHHRELLALDREQLAAVNSRFDEAKRRIRRELGVIPPERFRAQQLRISNLLIELSAATTSAELEGVLEALRQQATEQGTNHAIDEIVEWADYYGGEARGIDLGALLETEREILIERHAESLARWGQVVADRVRSELQTATITRDAMDNVVDIVDRSIDGERWQAERIVRTETVHSYNAAHNTALREARDTGQVEGVKKSAIATFDARTDEDSIPVHGQVRELDEPFVDGDGRVYQHPPGRPNDREKEIPWLDEADAENITPLEEGIAEANAERARQGLRELRDLRTFEGRRARLASTWTNGSHRRASIEMKRAALDEFDLPGISYERNDFEIGAEEIDVTADDLRQIYEDTQQYYREQGITEITLYRGIQSPVDDIGSIEAWTDDLDIAERFGTYTVLEERVDVRRVLWSKDAPGWRDGRFGDQREHLVLSDVPSRRWRSDDFEIGFFNSREVDPESERAGPFGIVVNESADTVDEFGAPIGREATLYHVPTGRTLASGDYRRKDLRQISRELERQGYVDPLGRLPDGDTRDDFRLVVAGVERDIVAKRTAQRRAARGALEWSDADFDAGAVDAGDLGADPETAGPWGIVGRDGENALIHVPTGEVVLDGPFDRRDLRRAAGELDQYLDDAGRLPGDRALEFGEFQEELASARRYYARNVVDGYPAIDTDAPRTNLGGVDFPAINADVDPGNPETWSRRVAKVVTGSDASTAEVIERKGYARGNFFIYKTAGEIQTPNKFEDADWHIVHLKTGIELHKGPANDFGTGVLPGGARLGNWRRGSFYDVAEELEEYVDASGNVIEERREDWIERIRRLQLETAPGENVVESIEDARPEDFENTILLSETRTRLLDATDTVQPDELRVSDKDAVQWFEDGPDPEEGEGESPLDEVPF